jgi:hypothetical protein
MDTLIASTVSHATNPTEDFLLPCTFAIDATNCNTFGRFKTEPLTMSNGSLKQSIRNTSIAMHILGHKNHSPKIDTKISRNKYYTFLSRQTICNALLLLEVHLEKIVLLILFYAI